MRRSSLRNFAAHPEGCSWRMEEMRVLMGYDRTPPRKALICKNLELMTPCTPSLP